MDAVLTEEQQSVFDQASRFIETRRGGKQWFYYAGLAGVGKSCVLAALGRAYPDAVPCAFTGKAASVLARKSGLYVSTLHQFIYNFVGEDKENGNVYFKPKYKPGELKGEIALLDEVSMIGNYNMSVLLDTGCKIIACGDPGQLQAVRDVSFFKTQRADATLTEIHRQALDSAIIRQAYNMRNNGVYCDDGDDFRVVKWFSAAEALSADAIICWRNATRHALNRKVREWRGLPGGVCKAGEPVMCMKNNHDLGILNGAVYTLLEDHIAGSTVIAIKNERGEETVVEGAWIEDFETVPYLGEDGEHRPFSHGYAFTCHKSQGSSFGRVIVIDEYNRSEERREFMYTAFTRSEQSVIVQRSW